MSDTQFRRGIEEFNEGHFFECHDTLEDLWHGTRGRDRLFLQGLIQISVGYYHFFNQNYKGATSQFTRGLAKLENYLPAHRGIEIKQFVQEVVGWLFLAEQGLLGEQIFTGDKIVPKLKTSIV
jgi:predicted metal-dependent hydrolase